MSLLVLASLSAMEMPRWQMHDDNGDDEQRDKTFAWSRRTRRSIPIGPLIRSGPPLHIPHPTRTQREIHGISRVIIENEDNNIRSEQREALAMAQHFPRAHPVGGKMKMGWKEDWVRERGKGENPTCPDPDPPCTCRANVPAKSPLSTNVPSPCPRPCLSVRLSTVYILRIMHVDLACHHTTDSPPVIAQRKRKRKQPLAHCSDARRDEPFLFSLGIVYHRKGWPGRV
jgi:hypothetical protein